MLARQSQYVAAAAPVRFVHASGRLLSHDDVALLACYLIDDQQLHRLIAEAGGFMPLSYRFDDEVAGRVDVAAAGLGVGDEKPARQDIGVAGIGMLVLGQCGIPCNLIG